MTVSVIIPTYNGQAFIRDAIESAYAQTFLPVEIIVVDDCSTDATATTVEDICRQAPVPSRLIRMPKNSGGPAAPTNRGIREAVGGLIHVLDQDDVLRPDTLRLNTEALASNPTANMAFNWCEMLGGDGETVQTAETKNTLKASGEATSSGILINGTTLLRHLLWRGTIPVGFPGFTFRRSAWEAVNGLNEELRIAADFDFLCRITETSNAMLVPITGFLRRRHSGNATRNRGKMFRELFDCRRNALKRSATMGRDRELTSHLIRECRRVAVKLATRGYAVDACHVEWQGRRISGSYCGFPMWMVRALATATISRVLPRVS